MFGYNMNVVNGVSISECKISKKHMCVCYHATREASASGIWWVGFVKGTQNITYFLTMIMYDTEKLKKAQKWMWMKYIPWGINEASVNFEVLSDIKPDRSNYLW